MRLTAVTVAFGWAALHAQMAEVRPFAVGEKLSYNAHAGPGVNGRAEMWVDGPIEMGACRPLRCIRHSWQRSDFCE